MKHSRVFLAVGVVLQAVSCATDDGLVAGKARSTDTASPDASVSTEEHEERVDSSEDTHPLTSSTEGLVPVVNPGTVMNAPTEPDAPDAAVEPEDPEVPTSDEDPGTEDTEGSDASTERRDECDLPPCLAQSDFESCQPDTLETCSATGGHPPTSVERCYENGVKARIVSLPSGSVVSFKTAAGADCYSLEITRAETIQYVWKTQEGNAVMTGTVQSREPDVVTYQCDGQTYVVDFSDPTCSFVGGRPPDTSLAGCLGGCSY